MSLIQMQASPTVIALVIYELQHYENLKFLDISGNDVSYEAAESLCDLIDNTKALEFLNLRSCLKAFLPARKLF